MGKKEKGWVKSADTAALRRIVEASPPHEVDVRIEGVGTVQVAALRAELVARGEDYMADENERQPDTVVFTFETTVDYAVDLRTGEVKRDAVSSDLSDEPHYVAFYCEGEFAGEAFTLRDSSHPEDQALIDRAYERMNEAFQAGEVTE